jgi:hypothetical protein
MLHGNMGYVLHPGRRHPDVNMFRQVEQRLCETRSVTSKAWENVGHPWTVQTPAIQNPVESDTHGPNTSFQTIVLYGCNFANGYHINILQMCSF